MLSERRFQQPPLGQPLKPAFDRLGRWLHDLISLAPDVPGGPAVFWGVLATAVLLVAVLGARRRLRRLSPAEREVRGDARAAAAETPQALEREAQAAEARGAFADAIRLRFRAGLLTLGARQVIDYQPSLRTAEVSRRLRSADFDSLARTFERVAYGGSRAEVTDVNQSRESWQRVVAEAKG